MNLLIQIFLLIFLFNVNAFSGESGELPGQELQQVDETTELTDTTEETPEETEGIDVSGVDEMLEPKNTEIDLPKNITSGLKHSIEVLKNVDSIKFTKFGAKDVVRHSLVQEIVQAYDNFEE